MSAARDALAAMGRLQAGDAAALKGLYDRYAALLYGVILRMVGQAAEAEDVLQQVWIQAWRGAASYDPARGSVASWLLTMARSRALDRLRSLASRRREGGTEAPVPDPRSPDPAAGLESRGRAERVRAALDRIDPRHREVLELAFFGGLTQAEIAARLGKPLGTVKTWARTGLTTLRAALADEVEA